MKIAVVGTGVSGLVAARELSADHELTVFESAAWIGGHTNTVDVETREGPLAVDTGFIVFNERTYPNFCRLMDELGVTWHKSDMSFSVRCDSTGLEYNGTSLNGLLAQRTNALSPRFWRMVRDIMRFYREAPAVLDSGDDEATLGAFLEEGGYSKMFVEKHLIPMGAAVWSSRPDVMQAFPLRFLIQFFHNHGFLQIEDRPDWLVISGGSRQYVEPLTRPYRDRIRLETPVTRIERTPSGVQVSTREGSARFDRVILATHADISLKLLAHPEPHERDVLGAFRYQRNEAVLHTDDSIMPKRRRAWASWNYHVTKPVSELPTVTYWMNNLQGFTAEKPYLVTLNRTEDIAREHVLREFVYHHPIYSTASVKAQERFEEIDGAGGVHYCGAYWSYGFHEDGVKSGLRAAERVRASVGSSGGASGRTSLPRTPPGEGVTV